MNVCKVLALSILGLILPHSAVKSELIQHYQFDSDLSDSAGSRDGTMVNGVESFAAGIRGGAMSLPGTMNSRISVNPWQPGLSSFTVAGWVFAASVDDFYQPVPVSYAMPLISFHSTGFSGGFRMGVFNTDNAGTYRPGIQLRGDDASFDSLITDRPYEFGQWVHLAATIDRNANQIGFYFNGDQVGSTNLTVTSLNPTKGFLGSYDADSARNGHDRYWSPSAKLDDIRVYDEVLSAGAIASLAAVPEPSMLVVLGFALTLFVVMGRRNHWDIRS